MGPSYFFLSIFVGNTGPGVSAHELAKNIWENKSGADLLATFESRKPMIQGWWRTVLIGGSFVIVLAIIAAATVLGLQTVLTWQAHIWWFPLLWVLLRMAPGLVELSFLCIIEWMLRRPGFPGNERTRHLFWLLLVFVWVLSLAGNGIIIIFGTAVLGSSTLIDGATARTYLFCLPTLYAVIHLLLLAAYLPTMPKGDQVNLDEVPLQSANPSFTQGEESKVEGRSPATIHMTF
ncbi:hypothetical protein BFJ70_g6213 [Fusarium oxysporum]|nr:hypothetical protein BFJ70_g6213 [Fusarium oxysporum]